jgi:hypothetical protein
MHPIRRQNNGFRTPSLRLAACPGRGGVVMLVVAALPGGCGVAQWMLMGKSPKLKGSGPGSRHNRSLKPIYSGTDGG